MPLRLRRYVHVCPLCGGVVERVHRHAADRFFALFRRLHRYRCTEAACAWEGVVSDDELARADALPHSAPFGRGARALWFFVGAAVTLASVQGVRMYRAELAAREARDAGARAAARLPDSAIRKFEALIEKKMVSDRVEITREGIATVSGRRKFDALSFDMAYGNIMCFNTRVNFRQGHVEHADLYEATDADGRRYTVMVPYVCGNVAVLGDREERNGDYRNGSTPEPESLALFATGSVLLAWFLRRRRREREASRNADR